MYWLAALALAASLLAGCDKKDRTPAQSAPAPSTSAPGAPAPSTPGAPAPGAGTEAAPAAGAQATTAGPEVPTAESLRRITELADKICACPDRKCAEDRHAAFQAENQQLAGRPRAKPTQDEAAALQAQAQRFSGCVQRLP
jgi:hypothetical protein